MARDNMVHGALVRRIFLLFGIFGGPYKGRFFFSVSNATNYYIYIKSMLETIPVTWSMIGS